MQKIQKRSNGTTRVCTINNDPSLTKQSFKEDCDINNIVKRHIPPSQLQPQFMDLSEIPDYQTMLNTTIHAREAFASLPASVRRQFNNNPGDLVAFIQDPKNYDSALKLGLVNPRPPVNDDTTTKTQAPVQRPKQKTTTVVEDL